MNKLVYVVLSSYNGERYIQQQIDTILAQKDVDIRLMIRDDGSTDKTIDILKEYEQNELINILYGANEGYSKSFLSLIHAVPDDAQYIAISDQDDIWDSDKLKNAVDMLEQEDNNIPLLYSCGRRLLIDGTIQNSIKTYKEYGFTGFTNGYALQGCSMVFNKQLKKLIDQYHYSIIPCIYDVLILQICKYNSGKVICDTCAHFTYRIHNSNSIGINSGGCGKVLKKILSNEYLPHTDIMCLQLMETYIEGVNTNNYMICKKLSTYKEGMRNKLSIIFDKSIIKGSIIRKCKVIVELLFNRA